MKERVAELDRTSKDTRNDFAVWPKAVEQIVVPRTAAEQLLSQIDLSELGDPLHPLRPIDPAALGVHRIERIPGTETYRVAFALDDVSKRYWLRMNGASRQFSAYLATDQQSPTRYLLEMVMRGREASGQLRISRLDIQLSQTNRGPLGEAAVAWQHYRRAQAVEAVAAAKALLREEVLEDPSRSPLAGLTALLVLLRMGDPELLANWPERLVKSANWLPDATVIDVECRWRASKEGTGPPATTIDALLGIEQRGLPLTCTALGLLANQLNNLRPPAPADQARRDRLTRLRTAANRALQNLRGGGLFCVFTAEYWQVNPFLLPVPA